MRRVSAGSTLDFEAEHLDVIAARRGTAPEPLVSPTTGALFQGRVGRNAAVPLSVSGTRTKDTAERADKGPSEERAGSACRSPVQL